MGIYEWIINYFINNIFIIYSVNIISNANENIQKEDNLSKETVKEIIQSEIRKKEIDKINKLKKEKPLPLPKKKEVYNVGENIFTYKDASKICKSLNGRLADESDMKDAFELGANWCNNGWLAGQNTAYPIQSTYHNKQVRKGETPCGKSGINMAY